MVRRVLGGTLGVLAIVAGGLFARELDRRAETPPVVLYDAPPEGARRVLWIGDESTTDGQLPYHVQRYARDAAVPLYIELVARDDRSLAKRLRTDEAKAALKSSWDAIVLQESVWRSMRALQWTRDEVKDVAADHEDTPVFHVEMWAPEDPRLGSLMTPSFVQATEDQWACHIDQLAGNVHAVPVGHALQLHRDLGERVVDYDGHGLTEEGVDIAARMLADALTEGVVPSGEIDLPSVCRETQPIDRAWSWGRTVRTRTRRHSRDFVLVQDAAHLLLFVNARDGYDSAMPELDRLGLAPDLLITMVPDAVHPFPPKKTRSWSSLLETEEGSLAGILYRRCGPACIRFDDVLLTPYDLGSEASGLLRADLPAAKEFLAEFEAMRPTTVNVDAFSGYEGAKNLRWLRDITRLSIEHSKKGTTREAFRHVVLDQGIHWPYFDPIPYPLTPTPQEAP